MSPLAQDAILWLYVENIIMKCGVEKRAMNVLTGRANVSLPRNVTNVVSFQNDHFLKVVKYTNNFYN
jgi:hypothetical protein